MLLRNSFKYLVIFLPLAAHVLIEFEYVAYSLIPVYISLLGALGIAMGLTVAGAVVQAALVGGVLALGLFLLGEPAFLIYIPSVVTPLLLAMAFALSLFPARTAIITRIAQKVHAPNMLSAGRVKYTRLLTGCWAGLFLLIAAEALALAVWSSVELWSLFANVLNYLFVGGFFILEYVVRTYLLKDPHSGSIAQMVRVFRQVGLHGPDKG